MERDGEIITLLALGFTRLQTAERCRMSERTVYRRLRDPKVQESLERARLTYQGMPRDLVRLYRILQDLRGGLAFVDELKENPDLALTAQEARKHLSNAVQWVEEWCWLKEQDVEQLHGDTCECVLAA